MNQYGFDGLEQKIGYIYKDKKLLRQAMTHTSFANEQKMNKLKSYERIEFLGDAILEMVSSEFFYFTYPDLPEGKLTQMRASSVCERHWRSRRVIFRWAVTCCLEKEKN